MYFDDPVETTPVRQPRGAQVVMSLNGLFLLAFGILPQSLMALCVLAVSRL
jgi:NADH-quinone oxidoreductase subunit N